ncbi:MAG TPA: acylphosphatase [Opitutales bacterium]|nr:acylphosphatase [Opitutales bacterium]
MPISQLNACFLGRVQGVGFRYQVLQTAKGFNVTGFIKNLNDGRVELCAQGERAELEAFLREVQSQWEGYVREVEVQYSETASVLTGFEIAR